jgi:hypothetical protein
MDNSTSKEPNECQQPNVTSELGLMMKNIPTHNNELNSWKHYALKTMTIL